MGSVGSASGIDATIAATVGPAGDGLAAGGVGVGIVDLGAVVGRYRVLGRLGAGSMGIVYAAHDPELDREVALKLVLPGPGGTPQVASPKTTGRLLREAQAMARLNHPNVIHVHDTGQHDGQVFIAMELVAGRTLTKWLSEPRRPWREVVGMLIQAGDGLAAAHEAGLVHRDFKPDNVLVGDDGRARVMDFGLARSADSSSQHGTWSEHLSGTREGDAFVGPQPRSAVQTTAIAGTPAYMAPEQFRGDPPGPLADQFSFCVAAWEGLFGTRPFDGDTYTSLAVAVTTGRRRPPPSDVAVPMWLERVLDRGLAVEAEQRWPTMRALLARVKRGSSEGRRPWIWVGGGGLLVGGLSIMGAAGEVAPCSGAEQQLADVWDPATRAAGRQGFETSELPFAPDVWSRVEERLDAYAQAWVDGHDEACAATHVQKQQSPAMMTARMGCLAQRRRALDALVQTFGTPSRETVEGALEGAERLPPIASCADIEYVSASVAPPDDPSLRARVDEVRVQFARANAVARAGDVAQGLELMRAAAAHAQILEYPPVRSEAALALGRLEERAGNFDAAESELRRAYFEASRTGARRVRSEAATELVTVVGERLGRLDDALQWGRHAEAELETVGGDWAALWNASGAVQHRAGDLDGATAYYDKALRRTEETGERLQFAATLDNLGVVAQERGALDEARRYHTRSLTIHEEVHGPGHPSVADSLVYLANVDQQAGRLDEAVERYRDAMKVLSRAYGPAGPRVGMLHYNLGTIEFTRGNHTTALSQFEQAVSHFEERRGPDHPMVATALNAQGAALRMQGRLDEALEAVRRAVEIQEHALGPNHANVGSTLTGLANIYDARDQLADALAMHERVERIWTSALGPEHPLIATAVVNQGLIRTKLGDAGGAASLLRRGLALQTSALGPDHPDVARTLLALGQALKASDRSQEAVPLLRRALELQDRHGVQGPPHGETELMLARALWASGIEQAEAVDHAESARATFVEHDATLHLADAEAWLGTHRRPR